MANKTVISLDMYCDKCKKVALHSVTKIDGIDSLSINMKDRTLTVIGDADPVGVANLLRKNFRCAQLVSAGPVPPPKPAEKPKEEKKEEKGKDEKKEEKKEEKKKEEKKKEEPANEPKVIEMWPQPIWYPVCHGQCYPPCTACNSHGWPGYYKPCSPSEGFYVWKEETRDICRIM